MAARHVAVRYRRRKDDGTFLRPTNETGLWFVEHKVLDWFRSVVERQFDLSWHDNLQS
jgi:hypothetical protein